MPKTDPLDNYYELGWYYTTEDPRMEQAVTKLMVLLGAAKSTGKIDLGSTRQTDIRNQVFVLLVNLIRVYRVSPAKYLGYFRDNKAYAGRPYENPLRVAHSITLVIDSLGKLGLLEVHKGWQGFRRSRISRVRAEEAFAKEYLDALLDIDFFLHNDAPALVLRGVKENQKKGKELPIQGSATTEAMARLVRRYRRFLRDQKISVPSEVFENLSLGLPDDVHIRRIFNNGLMTNGGRFYGAWWQHLKSEDRSLITINGKPTIELDYQGQTICHLYAREGLNYPNDIGGDPYELAGVPRKLTKQICVVILNTKTDKGTWKSVKEHFERDESPDLDIVKFTDKWDSFRSVLELFRKKHQKIAKYFHTMVALGIQFEDSEICAAVIEKLIDERIPVLTIHDSFIVEVEKETELRKAMSQAYLLRTDNLRFGLPKIEEK